MHKTGVLIVGAGPSGMVAALALAKSGIHSILIEKRKTPGIHPKAHEISGRTIEILNSLGIPVEELRKDASSHEVASTIIFCRTIQEEIGRIELNVPSIQRKYRDHFVGAPYFNISQVQVENLLRSHIRKSRRITLWNDCSWESLEQTHSRVRSRLIHKGTRVIVESSYVLGCEGAAGAVRNALGIQMKGPEQIQDFANVYFTNDLSKVLKTRAKLFFILRPDAAGTIIAHHPKKRWVYHVPILSPFEKVQDFTESVFRARLQRALGIPDFEPCIESISSWRMTAQVAESFQSRRVFLLGDSAHRFPPTGGLGLNSGVADAFNLCWKIAMVLHRTANENILTTYEAERKPVVEINCRESYKNYRRLMKIPRVLGLDVRYSTLIARLFALAPDLTPVRRSLNALLARLLLFADTHLQKVQRQAGPMGLVTDAIAREIGHFDRIGLDLGFRYGAGCILPDGKPATSSSGTVYVPDFSPGSRLPHFTLRRKAPTFPKPNSRKKKKPGGSHSLLDYTMFTLLCTKTESWKRVLDDSGLSHLIQLQKVSNSVTMAGETVTWADLAGISMSGAILVRPDGQIAARFNDPGEYISSLSSLIKVLSLRIQQRRVAA
ncbi:MAG: FAD-dependent monooxygenase [Leptospirales bacterium]|nr:FAD-dependent monooxygenase [Leptospirales bacterium]